MENQIISLAFQGLTIVSGALAAVLWYKLVQTDKDLRSLEIEVKELTKLINNVKFNYLDRFDDLKSHFSKLSLESMQKLTILETRFLEHSEMLKTLVQKYK